MKQPSTGWNSPSYLQSQNLSKLIGYLITVLMMVTLAIGVVQLGFRLRPDWNGAYLVILGLLVSVEAISVRNRVKELDEREKLFFHLSEWIAFAVAIKLLNYLVNGPSRLLRDLPLWQENFLRNFFTGEYILALIVVAAVWFSSRAYANGLDDLFDREQDTGWDELGKVQNALREIRGRIASLVFIIGSVVVALAIFSRIDASIIFRERGLPPPGYNAPVANALAYFILALILLSQTQFALMRTRWRFQRMPISGNVGRNWILYGFLFFLMMAVVVFFMPTEYSLGFFQTMGYALEYLIQAVTFLMGLLMLPLSFCLSLFNFFSENVPPAEQQAPVVPPQIITPADQPIAWLEFLRSLLFWGIFIAIIFFAFRYYLMQNKSLWNNISGFGVVRWLAGAWNAVRSWILGASHQVAALARSGMKRVSQQRLPAPTGIFHRVFNLSRMSPRDKIIHFYLSLVQMGSEKGLYRQPSQTPYQYEATLDNAIPEVTPELHDLTEQFLEARYSRHSFDEPHADQANSLWQKIKMALKNSRKVDE